MPLRLLIPALIGLCLVAVACALPPSPATRGPLEPPAPDVLRLATWNVHYIRLDEAEGDWSVADWDRRKGPMDDGFKALSADIVAFQEMESFQGGDDGSVNLARDYLLARNPDYAAAASGDWRVFPSTQPILFRRDRLRLLDQGWFFFSDTPDVIYSRTFDGSWPAFASWAQFSPAGGGPAFRIINVHFEYRSGSNRRLSAELVARRIGPWIAAGEPVVLLGDLNARDGSTAVEILERAGLVFAPVQGATYHFNRGLNLFGAIDHIAVTAGITAAGPPVVVRQKFRGEWPADHYPVVADYRLPR